MANFRVNLLVFLLLIVAFSDCLKTQFTEGRQLKEMQLKEKKKEHDDFSSVIMGTGLQIHARKAIQKPGNSEQKQISPPSTKFHEQFSSSDDVFFHANGFETTPGNSPGIGHPFAVEKNNMQADFGSVADKKDDFKGPGHSPGVGHSSGPKP